MGDDDRTENLRQWMAGLSADDAQTFLGGILGGGLQGGGAAPHTLKMHELPDPSDEPCALTVRVDVDEARPPVWRRLVLHGDLLLDEVHGALQAGRGAWPGPPR